MRDFSRTKTVPNEQNSKIDCELPGIRDRTLPDFIGSDQFSSQKTTPNFEIELLSIGFR